MNVKNGHYLKKTPFMSLHYNYTYKSIDVGEQLIKTFMTVQQGVMCMVLCTMPVFGQYRHEWVNLLMGNFQMSRFFRASTGSAWLIKRLPNVSMP